MSFHTTPCQAHVQVLLAAGDTFRAAASEQLEVWGQRAGTEVVTAQSANQRPDMVLYQVRRLGSRGPGVVPACLCGTGDEAPVLPPIWLSCRQPRYLLPLGTACSGEPLQAPSSPLISLKRQALLSNPSFPRAGGGARLARGLRPSSVRHQRAAAHQLEPDGRAGQVQAVGRQGAARRAARGAARAGRHHRSVGLRCPWFGVQLTLTLKFGDGSMVRGGPHEVLLVLDGTMGQ